MCREEWGWLQQALFLQSGMSYSDDVQCTHAQLAPRPSWKKQARVTIPSTKKIYFHGKKSIYNY